MSDEHSTMTYGIEALELDMDQTGASMSSVKSNKKDVAAEKIAD